MKAFIKSGLCLALGWLASGADAQEIKIKWNPSRTETPAAPIVQPPRDTGIRPVVRLQAPDDISVLPVPVLEKDAKDVKEAKKLPKDKDGFNPPRPQSVPTPVYSTQMPDGCEPDAGWCGLKWCRPHWFRACPDGPRFYIGAEGLVWWQKHQGTPPLITSSPVGTPTVDTGVLPGATVLYQGVPNQTHGGARFTVGGWFPGSCCNLGLEASMFFLARQSNSAVFTSFGDPQFARPFVDTVVGNNAEPFSIRNGTDVATGSATIHAFSQLWGGDVSLRYKWLRGPNCSVDLLVGYRHITLSEGIDITEDRQNVIVGGLVNGIHSFEQESFHTRNQFNGIQFGIDGEWRFGARWFLGVNTKVAFGSMYQIVNIDGSTTFSNVPAPFVAGTVPGALLASTTNIGRYTHNRFGISPEVGVKIGYDVTDRLRVFAGYDFLYLNNVVRPGDQIDPVVNQSFRPLPAPFVATGAGTRVPSVMFRTTDYWAQGFNVGLLYRY